MQDLLISLTQQAHGVYEAKGSKFLSTLVPFVEFEIALRELRESHPKAVHFVSASRWCNEYEQILESFDDDREPRGSSGMPCLNVLRGEKLVDVGVIVVRYFGGTLLGVGGLVRAYSKAVQDSILRAREMGVLKAFERLENWRVEIEYSKLSLCEYEAKRYDLIVEKEEFLSMGVGVCIRGQKENLERFKTMYNARLIY